MSPLLSLVTSTALLGAQVIQPASATKPPKPRTLVAAHLSEVDEDFTFQGEYAGSVFDGACVCQLGLQVMALGNGDFSALSYRGGLPGNGWSHAEPSEWTGHRDQSMLALTALQGRAEVRRGEAILFDKQGRERGRLSKVRRTSLSLGLAPPRGSVVLFGGPGASQFRDGHATPEGWLAAGATTSMPVHDFLLHLEFRTPYMPQARGQGRGNSGVYIQQRYEVQILDSFGLPPVFNGCAALYRQHEPDSNMSFPPLSWQTYDIYFTAARWDAHGTKIANARITVSHNGILVHTDREVTGKTGHGQAEAADDRPILLQNHGNPVQFRNVWLFPFDASQNTCSAIPPWNPLPAGDCLRGFARGSSRHIARLVGR